MEIQQIPQVIAEVERTVASSVVDPQGAIRLALVALVCDGHVLIEDVPGVGKTTLARTLAQALGVDFARIQGTTDLMPSEITGVSIWNEHMRTFEFHRGPVFAEVVLFDEINRTTPKTQSALLEAMEEHQVTVDGATHRLPRPFIVLATQNPIDYEGTFPLTEAQRDRFFLKVRIGYPTGESAQRLMDSWLRPEHQLSGVHQAPPIHPVANGQILGAIFEARARVFIDPKVRDYILALAQASHEHPDVRLGLSPRAWLMLGQAAQACAAFAGREFVTPDDVKAMLEPVAAHRLILYSKADLTGKTAAQVLTEIVQRTPAPAWPASAMRTRVQTSRPLTTNTGAPGTRR